ncbi:MAG: hypothetical protein EP319_17310 [Deltaproteobacteria bacterium]|nr:MAG: hypothetical protein EP319_17310 [Deltaproteobacteria bacterium]
MRYLFTCVVLFIVSFSSFADVAKDIKVLEINKTKDSVRVKLNTQSGPEGNWFVLILEKSDPQFDNKLKMIEAKHSNKPNSNFSIEIPSFTIEPSGAIYKAQYVKFIKPGSEKK